MTYLWDASWGDELALAILTFLLPIIINITITIIFIIQSNHMDWPYMSKLVWGPSYCPIYITYFWVSPAGSLQKKCRGWVVALHIAHRIALHLVAHEITSLIHCSRVTDQHRCIAHSQGTELIPFHIWEEIC